MLLLDKTGTITLGNRQAAEFMPAPGVTKEAMAEAAKSLVGKHDFVSFQTSGSSRLTTERTVLDLVVERRWAELTDRVVIRRQASRARERAESSNAT